MVTIKIGSERIADASGTHEPGDVVRNPMPDLVALAEAKTAHPETGEPYATIEDESVAAAPQIAQPVEPEPVFHSEHD